MRDTETTGVRIVRRGVGYAAHGPGFYVWDTEPRALLDSAQALVDRSLPRPPRRGATVRKARRRYRDPAA